MTFGCFRNSVQCVVRQWIQVRTSVPEVSDNFHIFYVKVSGRRLLKNACVFSAVTSSTSDTRTWVNLRSLVENFTPFHREGRPSTSVTATFISPLSLHLNMCGALNSGDLFVELATTRGCDTTVLFLQVEPPCLDLHDGRNRPTRPNASTQLVEKDRGGEPKIPRSATPKPTK